MEIQLSEIGTVRKIALAGRLDTAGVNRVETKFGAAIVPGGRATVVDLTEVSFLASMGIRMLITTTRALSRKGAKLAIYGAVPGVMEVIETTALSDIIPVAGSESEAIAIVTG